MKRTLAALLVLAACSSQKPAPAGEKADPPAPAATPSATPAAGTPAAGPPASPPAAGAGAPAATTPAAATPPAPEPAGAEEILSGDDLRALPDDKAREAARAFARAVAAEDAAAFLALVSPAGLKKGKKKLSPKDVEARVAKEGVGGLTGLGLDEEAKKVGARLSLTPTMLEPRFFLSGPGYGEQPAAFFEKQADGSWKIVALDIYDFGEP